MASELECPVCAADVPLAGDEKVGEEIFCPFCNSPCRISKKADDESEMDLEEDF